MPNNSFGVLVVDDHPAVRAACIRTLRHAGFTAYEAAGAAQARQALTTSSISLVLVDVHLEAGFDGLSLAREVKSDFPGIDVVVMTGAADVPVVISALRAGAVDFLTKPFEPHSLIETACSTLRRRRHAATSSQSAHVEAVKSAVLSRVSHELRTPIAVAMMSCEMLKTDLADERQRALADHLAKGIGRFAQRIEELLAFAAATGEPKIAQVDLAALVRAALLRCADMARAKGVPLRAEVPDSLLTVCEPGTVQRAIEELVSNAIRFGPTNAEVLVTAGHSKDRSVVTVADLGPGIPPEMRGRVFESFYQVADPLTRAEPGLGLGLSFARRVADAHGGALEIGGRDGGGTIACFMLPR